MPGGPAIDEPVRAMTGRSAVLLRGRIPEGITLGCNVAGIVVLAVAAVTARSVALAGFGLDSLIETGASIVMLWELSGTGEDRQRRALRLPYAAPGLQTGPGSRRERRLPASRQSALRDRYGARASDTKGQRREGSTAMRHGHQ